MRRKESARESAGARERRGAYNCGESKNGSSMSTCDLLATRVRSHNIIFNPFFYMYEYVCACVCACAGGGVTSGLKKVSKDQMTHKNPELRASSLVSAKAPVHSLSLSHTQM